MSGSSAISYSRAPLCHGDRVSGPVDAVELLVRSAGGKWHPPSTTGYINESELQALLQAQPSLIEGVSSDAVAVREFGTGVGPADVVIVDTDGSITVVECKLASNADIRRTIIGQVFDYAARLTEFSAPQFIDRWRQRGGPDLKMLLKGSDGNGRQQLEANLEAGVFTLVLAVDAINVDLRRIVRYLNSHTSAGMRLLAIELRRAVHEQVEILIPTIYGAESADEKNARSAPVAWSHESVDEWLRQQEPALADAVATFSQELAAAGFRLHGGGTGQYPSFSYGGDLPTGGEVYPFSVYCGAKPTLGLNFQWVERAGKAGQQQFLDDVVVAGAPVDTAEVTQADYRKRKSVPLSLILDDAQRQQFVAAALRLRQGDGPILSS